MSPSLPSDPAAPHVVEADGLVSLHFESTLIQSRMVAADPDRLVFDYTRTMMGFLLLVHAPARIAMIGLGGGSLAKACRRVLPDADFTAIECSPDVIALRERFCIPPDGPRFRVVCADGAEWVRRAEEAVDVLLVDGFDGDGQPPALCTPSFYADCAARLRPGGVLVVNMNEDETGYGTYVRHIRDAFRGRLVVVETENRENKIVFAGRSAPFPPPRDALLERAATLETTPHLALAETARRIEAARLPKRR